MLYHVCSPYFETDSRGLEQFLFLHGVRCVRSYQNDAHRTIWVYRIDPFALSVVDEWKTVLKRRNLEVKDHVS